MDQLGTRIVILCDDHNIHVFSSFSAIFHIASDMKGYFVCQY